MTTTHKTFLLAAAVGLFVAALVLHGPIAQWPDYHRFADARAWLGVPNAADVLSNLPFLVIGAWAAWRLRAPAWRAFALAVAATAFGSAYYHLAPDDARLVFDRLPIAAACALLACAFLAERIGARWAGGAVQAVAVLLAAASVGWWWLGQRSGVGDLRPYLAVQLLPMVLVLAGLALRLPARSAGTLPGSAWLGALALYALAKGCELADHALLDLTGVVSGHTLKHLAAAAAAAVLLRAAVSCGSRR